MRDYLMNFISEKILRFLGGDSLSPIEQMKLKLGIQVLCHNILMISVILSAALFFGMFKDALILFFCYGILKMHAGGIHFKKSWQCLSGTSAFIFGGVVLARHLTVSSACSVLLYLVCILILWYVGPQGTSNNPISESNYPVLQKRTLLIVMLYLFITASGFVSSTTACLLLIAVVFETLSILPAKFRKSLSAF